jgi:hypothetical protein
VQIQQMDKHITKPNQYMFSEFSKITRQNQLVRRLSVRSERQFSVITVITVHNQRYQMQSNMKDANRLTASYINLKI